jgi:hypothetical protein
MKDVSVALNSRSTGNRKLKLSREEIRRSGEAEVEWTTGDGLAGLIMSELFVEGRWCNEF